MGNETPEVRPEWTSIMSEQRENDLSWRLCNPLWVHYANDTPKLDTDATLADLSAAADEIASLRARLAQNTRAFQAYQEEVKQIATNREGAICKLQAQLASARKALEPFAMLAELDAKGKDGLETVYVMVAAGRLHDARRFLSQSDEKR